MAKDLHAGVMPSRARRLLMVSS